MLLYPNWLKGDLPVPSRDHEPRTVVPLARPVGAPGGSNFPQALHLSFCSPADAKSASGPENSCLAAWEHPLAEATELP